jgi:hypothetical protein
MKSGYLYEYVLLCYNTYQYVVCFQHDCQETIEQRIQRTPP